MLLLRRQLLLLLLPLLILLLLLRRQQQLLLLLLLLLLLSTTIPFIYVTCSSRNVAYSGSDYEAHGVARGLMVCNGLLHCCLQSIFDTL